MPGVVRARHPPPPLLPSIGPSWGRRQHVPENSSSPSSVTSHDYRLSVPQVSTKMSNGESSRACHCSKMAHILDTDNTRLSADVCTCSPEDHLRVCRQPQIPERHLPQTPAVKPSTATDLQAVGASGIENQCCCRRRKENGSVYIGNSFSAMNMEEEETCNEIVECVNQNCCFHHSSKCQIDTTQSVSINNTSNSNLIRDNSICCCVLTTTGQKDKVHCKTECKVTTCRTLSGKSFPASIADAISSRTGNSVTDCNVDRVSEDDNSSADSDDHLRSNSCISTEDTNQSSQCLPASSKSAAVTVPPRQRASSFRLAEVSTQVPRSENRKLINRKVFSMSSGVRVALTALLFFLALGLDNRILGANATERPRYRTTYACEGSTLNMECEAGHVINLIRANYGRFSITICNEHGNTEWSVNCMSRRSHRVLHDKCSQRQNCSVAASTRGFGDPCPGTLKYLEAQFQCVPVNIPLGRPRPIWLVDAQSTVSSITGDQPLKRPANSRDPSRGDDGSPSGIDGPGGPADPDGVGVLGTLPDGDDLDDPIDPDLLSDSDDSDTPSSSTTSTTTTTLRPPPWLKTNVTKNTTTTTTTTTTTSTTTTTTLPPPSSTDAERASSQTISSPRPPGHSYNSGAGGGGGGSSLADLPDGGEGGVGLDEDRILEQEETAEREVLFEEQDRLLNKELGHSFSQSYPGTPSGPGGGPLSEGEAAGWPPREAWCGPSSGRGLLWNWTQAGDMAIQACPGGASGWARRACLVEGWASRADLGECRSVWLSTLTARGLGKDSVLAVVHDLSAVTAVRALYGGDVTAAARLLSSLAKRMAISLSHFPDTAQREALLTELLSATLSSASHLIGSQEEAWGDLRPPDHRAAATALLLGLEQAAFLLADNLWQQKVVGQSLPNILMRLQVLETRNLAAITFPSQDEAWQNPTPMPIPPSPSPLEPAASSIILHQTSSSSPYLTTPSPAQSAYDSITLPPEALLENSENGLVKMVFFSYRGLEKLLQPDAVIQAGDQLAYKRANRTRLLNSRILAASLGSGRHIELSQPVIITFALLTTTNVTNASCVFWDYTTSLWSEEGCRVVGTNVTHVSCQCEHLTNFAVLMDFHATPLPPNHSLALAVITYVGCVVSIVCLILAILVFHVFRGLKSDRTSIHKNLCGCLLVAEVVFLGGVHQTGNAVVCGVVAGLLHYFFLAAFAWMFMEGLQLYLLLVEVFEAERSRLKVYCGICYGGPALIVLISAVVDPFGYGTERACWLSTENYFIFAFVGPVAAVLLANTVFLVLSLVVLCRHASASASLKNKEHTKLASVRTWLRGAFVLMFLLGLTWTFGLLYLNQQTLVMAYIFTVLNSLQGLFIFIFHCVQNDKYSFKSCGRDSGHGGSEQEDSPRSGVAGKLTSLRLNNNVNAPPQPPPGERGLPSSFALPHTELVNPEALLPDYRLAGETLRVLPPHHLQQPHRLRNQSPYNHTYTEISEGGRSASSRGGPPDPVYEEIEREGRLAAELQVSDLSDEDGRRLSSDVSRQSSRSYGDHRPLLPYTLPDHLHASLHQLPHHHLHHIQHQLHQHQLHQNHVQQVHMQQQHQLQQQQIQQQLQHQQLQHQLQQHHHHHQMQHSHHHSPPSPQHQAIVTTSGHQVPNTYDTRPRPEILNLDENCRNNGGPVVARSPHGLPNEVGLAGSPSVVQPLSEPNLRNWEAVQNRRDLALQQQLGEMTVAVLNGEQVVCKLKSPLAPIQETATAPQGTMPPTSTAEQQQHQPEQHIEQQSPIATPEQLQQQQLQQQQQQQKQQSGNKHPVTSLTYSHC